MAKKEAKKKKGQAPQTGVPPTGAVPPTGTVPPTGAVPPTGMVPPTGAVPPTGMVPPTGAVPPTGMVPPTGVPMTPEQEMQLQLEQAIKESNDPSSRLRKLKSPLSVGGCLLNVLFLVVLTLGIMYLVLYFQVDKFNFVTVSKDMLDKLGITGFFQSIGNWFKKLFGGGGEAAEILRYFLMRF